MVFGNKGDDSGTGVAFTRDPSTGKQGMWGEFLVNAQGEDVVAGIRTPEPIEGMESRFPQAHRQLADTMARLEEHYRDMQDIEFTIEEGSLYLLQTRAGKRTAAAALRVVVDMVGDELISRRRRRTGRPGPARPAAPPDDRPEGRLRDGREGSERLARRCHREIVLDATAPRSRARPGRTSSWSARRRRPTTSTGSSRRAACSRRTAA